VERPWGNGIVTAAMLQLTVLSFVTVNDTVQSPSQKSVFFHHPRVSPGDHPLTKKPADSGYEIGLLTI